MAEKRIGEITHYYHKIKVAVLTLTDTIRVGEKFHILGHTTDIEQQVKSLQIEHQAVDEALPGQDVAMKVTRRVRRGDQVYRVHDGE